MWKKVSLVGAAFAMGATALIPATPAAAQYHHRDYRGDYYHRGYQDRYGYADRDGYGRYNRHYYGRRGHERCRDNGDGGTIIGAIAGGLLGHEVAGYGDRTVGTVLGAGVGALAGRAIDRSDRPDYCR